MTKTPHRPTPSPLPWGEGCPRRGEGDTFDGADRRCHYDLQRSISSMHFCGGTKNTSLISRVSNRGSILLWGCLVFFGILYPSSSLLFAKQKLRTQKFSGSVVSVGPNAITVKSRENIYKVRTFNYSPAVMKKFQKKKPEPGKNVTVHYVRGTDLAMKVD